MDIILKIIIIAALIALNIFFIAVFIRDLRNKEKKMSKVGVACGVFQIITGVAAICIMIFSQSVAAYVIAAVLMAVDSFIQNKFG